MGWKSGSGMSLIEVVVAVAVLGLVTVALLQLFLTGSVFTAVAGHEVAAANLAQEVLEEIKSIPWNQIGTAQGGTADKILLDPAAGSENGKYMWHTIALTSGTGAGQVRQVVEYSDINTATVSLPWDEVPDNTTRYILFPWPVSGKAQGGTSNTIVLDSSLSQEDGYYKGYLIAITGGRGTGQWRRVVSSTGSTVTVDPPWNDVPDATSEYRMVRETCPYRVLEKGVAASGDLITFEVTVIYQDRGQLREVSLTTDKLRR
ncbi:prepilin-type N-terminal cleavage/methylation domain-containing protein [Desulfofundulus thermocisternus]|uniref:prepilin-type N-terminal cleavage/methylation domain-containing protein n=1 Tax=Desulfofundulus thermocisternus TaxID=42471 RepID=UPI000A6C2865|nr:prepilin-type N-terminal cleavage/methylation domain-containing protein [Desulfofundulus thermocisternus]